MTVRKLKPQQLVEPVSWFEESQTPRTMVLVEPEERWSGLYDSAGRKLMIEREPIGFVRLDRVRAP